MPCTVETAQYDNLSDGKNSLQNNKTLKYKLFKADSVMNRTEEFQKVATIYLSEAKTEEQLVEERNSYLASKQLTPFVGLCLETNKNLTENDILVQKMDRL